MQLLSYLVDNVVVLWYNILVRLSERTHNHRQIKNVKGSNAYKVAERLRGSIMKKYYNYYGRNFNNEYETICVENKEEEEELMKWYKNHDNNNNLVRVTLKELRGMTPSVIAGGNTPKSVAEFLKTDEEDW